MALSGGTDSPCKWMGDFNMGCRSCSGFGDCDENEEDTGTLGVIWILLIVVVVILGLGGIACCVFVYMRREASPSPAPTRPIPTAMGALAPKAPPHTAAATAMVRPAPAPGFVVATAVKVVPAAGPAPVTFQPMRVPDYWETHEGVNIVPVPNMMVEMQQLMTDTWKVKYTRDRKLAGGTGKVPKGCRVTNVLRVENHASYNKTWRRKQEVRARRREVERTFQTTTTGKLNKLEADVNEVYLFHGTSPQAADSIARTDFRIANAGSSTGMMFGPGIYLAENSSKSDEYAKEGEGVFVGQYAMLICRSVAGKVLTVTDAGDYSGKVTSQEYDSVCGDRLSAVGTFREMVFYQEDAVYAEYIVIYVREEE